MRNHRATSWYGCWRDRTERCYPPVELGDIPGNKRRKHATTHTEGLVGASWSRIFPGVPQPVGKVEGDIGGELGWRVAGWIGGRKHAT
jgi:hypothetical protein